MPVILGIIAVIAAIYALFAAIVYLFALVAGVFMAIAFMTEGVSSAIGLGPVAGWFLVWSVIGCSSWIALLHGRLRADIPSVSLSQVEAVVRRSRVQFFVVIGVSIAAIIAL